MTILISGSLDYRCRCEMRRSGGRTKHQRQISTSVSISCKDDCLELMESSTEYFIQNLEAQAS